MFVLLPPTGCATRSQKSGSYLRLLPFLLEQAEVLFIPKMVTEVVTLAESSFVNETEFAQNPLRPLIPFIDNRLDTVKPHLGKRKREDRGESLAHDALSPRRLVEFIADLCPMKSLVEGVKTTGPNEDIAALARDAPLNVFVPSIPFLHLADKCL